MCDAARRRELRPIPSHATPRERGGQRDVDPSLGSRHRAALGLAQETDAVITVVSEETGRISVACEGQLYLGLDGDALRELLRATLAPKRRGRMGRLARPRAEK